MQLFASKVDEDGKFKVKIIPSTPQHNADKCGVVSGQLIAGQLIAWTHNRAITDEL